MKDHSSMSPEVDLLETLTGQDEKLYMALLIFGEDEDEANFERARRVVQIYADAGLVQISRKIGNDEQILKDWEIKFVLKDKANWLNKDNEPIFLLSLTQKGNEVFIEDSASFFDQLFSQQHKSSK